jgi:hypothetical protein
VRHVAEFDVFAVMWDNALARRIQDEDSKQSSQDSPWLAIAFNAGQQHRLSPSFGGTYSGHFPPAPGSPSGVTCPTFRLGVTTLTISNPKSQVKTATFWIALRTELTINIAGREMRRV